MKVLVAHEQLLVASMVATCADLCRHSVVGMARSEVESSLSVHDRRPDLVVIGDRLSGRSGLALAREYYERYGAFSLLVARGPAEDHSHAVGVVGVVSEPFPANEMVQALKAAEAEVRAASLVEKRSERARPPVRDRREIMRGRLPAFRPAF